MHHALHTYIPIQAVIAENPAMYPADTLQEQLPEERKPLIASAFVKSAKGTLFTVYPLLINIVRLLIVPLLINMVRC